MPTENYTSKFRVDVSDLKKGITDANNAIKKANAEFKNATAGMDDWAKSADGLTAKIKEQQKRVEEEQKKLDLYKQQLDRLNKSQENGEKIIADLTKKHEEAAKQYGATSEEAKKYAKQLSDAEAAQERNRKAAEKLELQIINQDTAVKNAKSQVDKYSSALDDLENEEKQTSTAAEKLDDNIEEVGTQAQKTTDGGLSSFAVALGNLATKVIVDVTRKLGALITSVVDTGQAFDSSMSNVKAISGATAEDVEALSESAQNLGATTKFTATEVADGFGYMAMAGWKTEDMLEGINGVLALSAASNTELATTSDIVTDALTAFGEQAEEAGRLADIMAAASSNANTNVEMMGETFKYAASLAGSMGYSMEDVAIATGLMANSGIKATQAGTSLRALMTRMAAPTKESGTAMDALGLSLEDGEGNMKSFMEVMKDIRSAFGDMKISQEEFDLSLNNLNAAFESGEITEDEFNDAQEELIASAYGAEGAMKAQYASMLAGKNGLSGFLAIVNASEEDFNKLTDAVYNSEGAAQSMADTMIDNLGGDLTLLSSAFDAFKMKIYESVSAPLRDIVQGITGDVLPALTALVSGEEGAAEQLGNAVGGLLTNLVSKISELLPQAVQIGVSLISSLATGILDALPSVVSTIADSITIIISALGELIPELADKVLETLPILGEALYNAIPQILNTLLGVLTQLVDKLPDFIEQLLQTAPKVWKAISDALQNGVPKLVEGVKKLIMSITKALPNVLKVLTKELPKLISGAIDFYKTVYPLLLDALIQISTALLQALPDIIGAWNEAAPDLLEAIGDALVDNAPLLVETFKTVWGLVFDAIPPLLTALWDTLKTSITTALSSYSKILKPVAKWVYDNIIATVIDFFSPIAQWISDNVFTPIMNFFKPVIDFFSSAFDIIFELAEGCWTLIKGVWSKISDWFKVNVVEPIESVFDEVVSFFSTSFSAIFELAEGCWKLIKGVWEKVSDWYKTNVIKPVEDFFKPMWDNLKAWASDAWDGIKAVFSTVADFFESTFRGAWEKVKAVFSVGGKVFDGIKEGIVSAFNETVNALIRGINKVVTIPFENINSILDTLQSIEVLGMKPFENLVSRIDIPQIPELEYGGIMKRGQVGLLEGKNDEAIIPLQRNMDGMRRIAGLLAEELKDFKSGDTVNNYNFTQTNNSPKALSRWEIYQQSKNLFNAAVVGV